MAVPRHRHSKAKVMSKRAHHALSSANANLCPNCGAGKLAHRACPSCFTYKGRSLVKD